MKMTEEELIKEATSTTAWRCITMIDRPLFVRGYIMGAEPREKQIEELENRLTKAKDIIKKLVEGIKIISDPKVCLTDADAFVSEAEQFLKEK